MTTEECDDEEEEKVTVLWMTMTSYKILLLKWMFTYIKDVM